MMIIARAASQIPPMWNSGDSNSWYEPN